MRRILLNRVRSIIPKLSETELIVLRSGTVSMDRDIFNGYVDVNDYGPPQTFNHGEKERVIELLNKYKYEPSMFDKNKFMNRMVIQDVADQGFFSYLIDSTYGGRKQAATELSKILTTISSIHPALGVITMVPNSLGPGELLTSYGTEEQKKKLFAQTSLWRIDSMFWFDGTRKWVGCYWAN